MCVCVKVHYIQIEQVQSFIISQGRRGKKELTKRRRSYHIISYIDQRSMAYAAERSSNKKEELMSIYAARSREGVAVVEEDYGVTMKDDDELLTKIRLIRAFLESHDDPSLKDEVDDLEVRRFLRARGLDVEKASAMLLKCLKWRRSFLPNGSVSVSEVPNEVAQNKMFAQGHDKTGRPITIVLGARHFQNKIGGLDEFRRFVVYGLDKLCARMPAGQEKFVGIGELKGWGYSNSDVRGYIASLRILQDYYPERLGKLFIVHAPYMFIKVWKIIYPFIDNETKKKIVFVENNKVKSTLLEDIDESQLPEIYGGPLPLVPIQDYC